MNYYLKQILVHCIIARIYSMLSIVFKRLLHPKYPNYIKRLFKFRTSKYILRGQNRLLALIKPRATKYGFGVD